MRFHPLSRPLLLTLFGTGAAGSLWIAAPPLLGLAAAACGALAAARRRVLWVAPAAALVAGVGWGNLRAVSPAADPLVSAVARSHGVLFSWVQGTVSDSEPWTDGSRCLIRARSFDVGGAPEPCRATLLAYLPTPPPPDGAPVEASLRLALPKEKTNPGQFDAAAYLSRQDVDLTATARTASLVKTGAAPWWRLASRYRRGLEARMERDAPRSAGILLALLMGERGLISPESQDDLSVSGLYHLVALSGLNVGLFLLLAAWTAPLFGLHPAVRDGASLVLLAAYALLVHSSPSLSRALLMALLFLLARMTARPQGARFAWSAAFAVLLAVDPRWLLDAGFQLTFAATAGILLLWDAYPPWLPQAGAPGSLVRLLWVGLSAQIATLPLLALTFHRISLLGWLATPLASLPLLAIQALGTLYLLGLAFVPGLHQVLGTTLDLLGRIFLWTPEVLGRWRLGSVFVPVPWWGWVSLYVGALVLLALPGRRRLAGWVLATFAAVAAWAAPRPWAELPRRLTVLDVGQASAQVVQWDGTAFLVDAGNGNFEGPSSARTVIEPFLALQGERRLGGIVLTHWDADHSGAAADLLRDLPVGYLAYPLADPPTDPAARRLMELARSRSVRIVPLAAGERLLLPPLEAEVWHPPAPCPLAGQNDRSLVLEIRFPGGPFLFTGDLEREGESRLLASGRTSPVYALLAPHHGSASSSSPAWVARLAPRLVLVSVGRNNRFGHPAPEVLGRYAGAGARILRTDRDGALTLTWEGLHPLAAAFR